MGQQTVETEYGDGEFKSLPILYENPRIRIYKNQLEEIFVEDIKSGVTIRFTNYRYHDGGLQFVTNGRIEPTLIAEIIGWRVSSR